MTDAQTNQLWAAVDRNQTAMNTDAETVQRLASAVDALQRVGVEAPTEVCAALRDAVQVLRNSAAAYSGAVESADAATGDAAEAA